MTGPLSIQARIVAELRERLKAAHGLEDGDDALEDTLDGASDLPEMLAQMARSAVWQDRQAEAMDGIIKANQDRKSAFEHRAEQTRNAMSWAMQESGMKKIPADALPDLTVTVSTRAAAAEIPNDDLVPIEFCAVKTVKRPNRALITERLRAGERFEFAYLPNPKPVLTIRSK